MLTVLSMSTVLVLFYGVFLSQIFLLSVHYPGKLGRRIEYVLNNFPPAEYSKLYPAQSGLAHGDAQRWLRVFKGVNWTIALLGMAILVGMGLSGYRPDLKGGDEIFVLPYFFLQICPLLYVEIREAKHLKLMRRAFANTRRTAELKPRRLMDFVSPVQVGAAVVFYFVWLAYYLHDASLTGDWGPKIYVTIACMTGMNLLFFAVIMRLLRGKKINPYQAPKDQLHQMELVAKAMVFASLLGSVFLTLAVAMDRYALEVLDPPMTSLYLQLCAAFGIGFIMRNFKIESVDFEVYKEVHEGDSAPLSREGLADGKA